MRSTMVLTLFLAATTTGLVSQSPAWPQWRGPERDGLASGFQVPAAWPASLVRKWEAVVGLGHASPVIARDRIVIHTREGASETISAFDLESGRRLWRDTYAAPYEMNSAARAHGPGPKSTPAIASGRVFTFGISGILSAIDVESGKVLWRTPPASPLPLYGSATSPIVDGDRVIVFTGGHDKGALTAFDVATGTVRWRWGGDGPGYSSPVIGTFDGTRQIVTQSERRVVGVSAADGTLLWEMPFQTSFDQNVVTPLISHGLVISSGLEQPTVALRISRKGKEWQAEEAWRNPQVSMYMSSPATAEQAIFGLSHRNRGQFFALDAVSGKTLWTSRGREGDNASIVRAGGLLLLSTTNAELIVARASSTAFEEVKRYTIADSATWAHPAYAGRVIVVKDVEKLIVWSY
jgi:outer membrane protein assembly factor BamB